MNHIYWKARTVLCVNDVRNTVALPFTEAEIMSSNHSSCGFGRSKAKNAQEAETAQAVKPPGLKGLRMTRGQHYPFQFPDLLWPSNGSWARVVLCCCRLSFPLTWSIWPSSWATCGQSAWRSSPTFLVCPTCWPTKWVPKTWVLANSLLVLEWQ